MPYICRVSAYHGLHSLPMYESLGRELDRAWQCFALYVTMLFDVYFYIPMNLGWYDSFLGVIQLGSMLLIKMANSLSPR